MFKNIKNKLYFVVAAYFRFFAQIQLLLWRPKIIVITGSTGKTTLLHLIESNLGSLAKYSHLANSSFGIPFNILGLQRRSLSVLEWPFLFSLAPIKAFKSPPKEKIYIVEADCDRPKEGKFLASLLKPEVTIWLSVSKTHSVNFDALPSIAFEFGYFLEYSQKYAIINGDNYLIAKQLSRTKTATEEIYKKNRLQKYQILPKSTTEFTIDNEKYSFKFLLPEDTYYSIRATFSLLDYLHEKKDQTFNKLTLPPGRSSVFSGIKNTTIIDSSYNATPASMAAALNMYKAYPAKNKWAIISGMVDLGKEESIEHKNLAKLIASSKLDKVILMGPRITKYTLPILKQIAPGLPLENFQTPKEVLDYLEANISGGEVLFFKGARFLEGVIEHLLKNKDDINKLCRREDAWEKRREQWGL